MCMTCDPTHAGETMPGKLWGKLRSTVYQGERTLRLMGSFAFTPGDEVIVGTTVNSGRWRLAAAIHAPVIGTLHTAYTRSALHVYAHTAHRARCRETERATVAAVRKLPAPGPSGGVDTELTMEAPLAHTHIAVVEGYGRHLLEMRGEVGLLLRSNSSRPSGRPSIAIRGVDSTRWLPCHSNPNLNPTLCLSPKPQAEPRC